MFAARTPTTETNMWETAVLLLVLASLPVLPLASGVADAVQDAPRPTLSQRIEQRCRRRLEQITGTEGVPGASLALVLPDGTEIALATGYASREGETPLKPSDRLLSGSTGHRIAAALQVNSDDGGALGLPLPRLLAELAGIAVEELSARAHSKWTPFER